MMQTRPIVIFIPFKGQVELLERCLISIERYTPQNVQIVVYDDGSEEPDFMRALKFVNKFQDNNLVRLLSRKASGFVKSCNYIFEEYNEHDVLLLNSDTEVTSGWFESMVRVRDSMVRETGCYGAVSPTSNNASIFTVRHRHNRDAVSLEVPTCNGFCMLMSRDAINTVGDFSEIFLTGYGEEVDWCLRARKAGFGCYMAAGAFVRHVGAATFGADSPERAVQRARADSIIRERYPEFQGELYRFLASGAYWTTTLGGDLRAIWDGANWQQVVIHVMHSWEALAGVELATRALIRSMPHLGHIVLYPKDCRSGYEVECIQGVVVVGVSRSLMGPGWEDATATGGFLVGPRKDGWHLGLVTALFEWLMRSNVAIHVHHCAGFGFEFVNSLFDAFPAASRVLDLHDYWLLCPNLFRGENGDPCGAWQASAHDRCSACFECAFGSKDPDDLERVQRAVEWHWREADKLLAREDVEFTAPSSRVVEVFQEWNGSHPKTHVLPPSTLVQAKPSKLRVAFVGNATAEKGWRIFAEAAEMSRDRRLNIEWRLYGQLGPGEVLPKGCELLVLSPPMLLGWEPSHLVPAMAGDHRETYCMVADECAATGIPILVRRGTRVVEERYPMAQTYASAGGLISHVLSSTPQSNACRLDELYWPHDP